MFFLRVGFIVNSFVELLGIVIRAYDRILRSYSTCICILYTYFCMRKFEQCFQGGDSVGYYGRLVEMMQVYCIYLESWISVHRVSDQML